MLINTDYWSWAGCLLFIAQLAWVLSILNLAISTLLFGIQLFAGGSFFVPELPVTFELQNLSDQFNSQLPGKVEYFSFDDRVHSSVDIIGQLKNSGVFIYIISLMQLASYAGAVFLLGLIKDVLKLLKFGKPFQPGSGRNLYWIGGIICMITPAKLFYEWIIYHHISQYPLPSNITMQWPLPDWSFLIVGLIILSIAYAFNEGARMAREQHLTV